MLTTPRGPAGRAYDYDEAPRQQRGGNFTSLPAAAARQAPRSAPSTPFMRVPAALSDGPRRPRAEARPRSRPATATRRRPRGGLYPPPHLPWHHTVRTYGIPRAYLVAVLDGGDAWTSPGAYETSRTSTVMLRVGIGRRPGRHSPSGLCRRGGREHVRGRPASFQLTNISVDLGDGRTAARVLPDGRLERFGTTRNKLSRGEAKRRLPHTMA